MACYKEEALLKILGPSMPPMNFKGTRCYVIFPKNDHERRQLLIEIQDFLDNHLVILAQNDKEVNDVTCSLRSYMGIAYVEKVCKHDDSAKVDSKLEIFNNRKDLILVINSSKCTPVILTHSKVLVLWRNQGDPNVYTNIFKAASGSTVFLCVVDDELTERQMFEHINEKCELNRKEIWLSNLRSELNAAIAEHYSK